MAPRASPVRAESESQFLFKPVEGTDETAEDRDAWAAERLANQKLYVCVCLGPYTISAIVALTMDDTVPTS